ncbi:MAG TPA: DNA-processing protein DprA [Galbitalea sp.]|jgi:DNA processing protein|nr:DNA-processing protein DprA [Galbitalea sp.]
MFGLKEAEVATLIRAVASDDLDREGIRDRFARATWTGIAEPGDRMAGLAVETLGAAGALDAVVERWPTPRWLAAFTQAGVDAVPEDEVGQAIDRWQPRLKSETALLALRQSARFGARLLTPDQVLWPAGLSDLGLHAPLALWLRGTDGALASLANSIAMVGARAATSYGENVTMEASAGLVDRGFAIVSGAAYGIDGMAHRAALASHGQTIAFLAGGVDRFYPSGHDALITRIVAEGAILSELPVGQPPTKWRFLQRNRLIAAASQATIVVEAGWRSGSLNTAAHASTLGRPLGAVPGPVNSATSAGCHRLIRDYDATLVTNPDEMAELVTGPTPAHPLDGAPGRVVAEGGVTDSPEVTRLLDALSVTAPRATGDIAARCGLSIAAVQSLLGRLELDDRVAERERGWIKRRPAKNSLGEP